MPGERGTFDANWKVPNAREDFQIAEPVLSVLLIELADHHSMKLAEKLLGFLLGLPFDGLGHHAGGGFGNSAAGAFEAYVPYRVVFQVQVDRYLIAAERIKPLGGVVGRFELAKVSRLLVVIEDDLLIEFAEFRHI